MIKVVLMPTSHLAPRPSGWLASTLRSFRCWASSSVARIRLSHPTSRRMFSASSTSLKNDLLPLHRPMAAEH